MFQLQLCAAGGAEFSGFRNRCTAGGADRSGRCFGSGSRRSFHYRSRRSFSNRDSRGFRCGCFRHGSGRHFHYRCSRRFGSGNSNRCRSRSGGLLGNAVPSGGSVVVPDRGAVLLRSRILLRGAVPSGSAAVPLAVSGCGRNGGGGFRFRNLVRVGGEEAENAKPGPQHDHKEGGQVKVVVVAIQQLAQEGNELEPSIAPAAEGQQLPLCIGKGQNHAGNHDIVENGAEQG